jgi:hypothetical protein
MMETVNIPKVFPRQVSTAVSLPHAIALAIVKSTLGPGAKMMARPAMMYSHMREGIIKTISQSYFEVLLSRL